MAEAYTYDQYNPIGHKKNDVVEVRAPAGVSQFKILNIRK